MLSYLSHAPIMVACGGQISPLGLRKLSLWPTEKWKLKELLGLPKAASKGL